MSASAIAGMSLGLQGIKPFEDLSRLIQSAGVTKKIPEATTIQTFLVHLTEEFKALRVKVDELTRRNKILEVIIIIIIIVIYSFFSRDYLFLLGSTRVGQSREQEPKGYNRISCSAGTENW